MAEPPDPKPAAAGRGHLRASYADREQVIGILKAAFVQGRLAKDELDLRVGQALASRTYADLAAVTADLPVGLAAAQPPQPAGAPGGFVRGPLRRRMTERDGPREASVRRPSAIGPSQANSFQGCRPDTRRCGCGANAGLSRLQAHRRWGG